MFYRSRMQAWMVIGILVIVLAANIEWHRNRRREAERKKRDDEQD